MAHYNLGISHYGKNRLHDAIAALQNAIDLGLQIPQAYSNLGVIYGTQQKMPEAISAFRKAIDLDPKHFNAYIGLGKALLLQGSFADAAAATSTGLHVLPPAHPLRARLEAQFKKCQHFLGLEKRLAFVLEQIESTNPPELLELARMCQEYKKRHGTGVRLYQQAFKSQPGLAKNLGRQHRYNAGCAAALAGTGQGEEAAKLKEEEKSKLRRQAHDWLQADLEVYAKQIKDGKAEAVMQAAQRLPHWQQDADLAAVRAVKELAKLPGEEKQAWQKLWADVQQLHKDAQSRFTETRLVGTLTAKEARKVHEIKRVQQLRLQGVLQRNS